MPRLTKDIVSVRIPNKSWLGDKEREIIENTSDTMHRAFGADSYEVKTYDWMVHEICHLREKVSNLNWQLYPDTMGG